MIGALLTLVSLVGTYFAARRSLVAGLSAMLAAGYIYGITRANLLSPATHFLFDAALIGLYSVQLFQPARSLGPRSKQLQLWVFLLLFWPVLITFVPAQPPLVSLIGLRSNTFFIPLLLLGSRLTADQLSQLALNCSALNLLALCFGLAEYFLGVPMFYPESAITSIIYSSKDVAGYTAFRIPAIFSSAHAYAGTMTATLPLLIGAWIRKHPHGWQRALVISGLLAAMTGVLLASARSTFVQMAILLLVASTMVKMNASRRLVWIGALVSLGYLAAGNERLQRFTTLADTDMVKDRVAFSVNMNFFDVVTQYPMGNGIASGGTSIPHFLQSGERHSIALENEYSRIVVEQGVIGLLLWAGFIIWLLARFPSVPEPWSATRRLTYTLCLVTVLTGMIGVGMLVSIPQSCIFLLCTGWMAAGARTFEHEQQPVQELIRPRQLTRRYA